MSSSLCLRRRVLHQRSGAEEVVVCAHTKDFFGGKHSSQRHAIFTGFLVDNATRGKISEGDRCTKVQCLESEGSEEGHVGLFGTQCLQRAMEQGC